MEARSVSKSIEKEIKYYYGLPKEFRKHQEKDLYVDIAGNVLKEQNDGVYRLLCVTDGSVNYRFTDDEGRYLNTKFRVGKLVRETFPEIVVEKSKSKRKRLTKKVIKDEPKAPCGARETSCDSSIDKLATTRVI